MDWCCSVYKTVKSEIKRCLGFQKDDETIDQDIHKETKEKEKQVSTSETRIQVSLNDDVLTEGKLQLVDKTIEDSNLMLMAWKQLIAGGLGGLVSRTSTAPLDRIKILLQASAGKGKEQISLYRVLQKILAEGGVQSLWRGNLINCMKVGPESAIRLFTFEQMKAFVKNGDEKRTLEMYQRFLAGASAGIVAQTAIYPMEVVRTRMAIAKTGVYNNIFDCISKLSRELGMRSFYRGILPSLIGIVPNAGIDLCIYETMKYNWLNSFAVRPDKPSFTSTLFAGGVSSLCSMSVCYPFALVRTNLQAETLRPHLHGRNEFVTMKNTFQAIIKDHGIRGLYRGIVPNMLKVVPACSISYVVYEQARNKMGL